MFIAFLHRIFTGFFLRTL